MSGDEERIVDDGDGCGVTAEVTRPPFLARGGVERGEHAVVAADVDGVADDGGRGPGGVLVRPVRFARLRVERDEVAGAVVEVSAVEGERRVGDAAFARPDDLAVRPGERGDGPVPAGDVDPFVPRDWRDEAARPEVRAPRGPAALAVGVHLAGSGRDDDEMHVRRERRPDGPPRVDRPRVADVPRDAGDAAVRERDRERLASVAPRWRRHRARRQVVRLHDLAARRINPAEKRRLGVWRVDGVAEHARRVVAGRRDRPQRLAARRVERMERLVVHEEDPAVRTRHAAVRWRERRRLRRFGNRRTVEDGAGVRVVVVRRTPPVLEDDALGEVPGRQARAGERLTAGERRRGERAAGREELSSGGHGSRVTAEKQVPSGV